MAVRHKVLWGSFLGEGGVVMFWLLGSGTLAGKNNTTGRMGGEGRVSCYVREESEKDIGMDGMDGMNGSTVCVCVVSCVGAGTAAKGKL